MSDTLLAQRIGALARTASIEISPREIHELDAARANLPAGAVVTITWMPKDTNADRIAAARAVRLAGFEPVPHLAARRIASCAELADLLQGLRGEADVRSVFVVGGDVKTPRGPFASAHDLMASEAFTQAGIERAGVAGYPEPHPLIGADALQSAYAEKHALLAQRGAAPFMVTQFSFDPTAIVALVRTHRRAGDATLIRIGLAGPASFAALMRFAARCGVAASSRALRLHGGALTKMLGQTSPEPIIRTLAATPDFDALGAIALHFFSFGGFAATAAWMRELATKPISGAAPSQS